MPPSSSPPLQRLNGPTRGPKEGCEGGLILEYRASCMHTRLPGWRLSVMRWCGMDLATDHVIRLGALLSGRNSSESSDGWLYQRGRTPLGHTMTNPPRPRITSWLHVRQPTTAHHFNISDTRCQLLLCSHRVLMAYSLPTLTAHALLPPPPIPATPTSCRLVTLTT